ncbi:MAG: hypothetical protein ACRDMJ_20345 [Solirubrobacteraceae bacterium]
MALTLIVIVNVVLSLLILGATVTQLARSITGEHRAEQAGEARGRAGLGRRLLGLKRD